MLAIYAFTNWLFRIDFLRPFSNYKMFFVLILTVLFYFYISTNEKQKKAEFLFISILYAPIWLVLFFMGLIKAEFSDLFLAVGVALVGVSWRLDSIRSSVQEEKAQPSTMNYFNLVYVNSAKSYEIATLLDDTVKTSIQKEKNTITSHRNSFKIGMKKNIYSGYENSSELSAESKISESFEVKSTKSTIFRKVYEMSKLFPYENFKQGDLIRFDSIAFSSVNAQDIPLLLQVLQSSKFDNPTTEGVELNMSNLLSTFLTDYTIDYSFNINNKKFLVRFPYGEVEGFENGYRHSDLQLGNLSLVGINRGEIDFSKVDTISTKFLEFMGEQVKSDNAPKEVKSIIPKSSVVATNRTTESEFAIDFRYKKLTEKYHLIDAIAVVQKINVE